MASESPPPKTLTLDSTNLFLSSLNKSLPAPLSFHPIPSTFPPSKLIPNTRFLIDAFRLASSDISVSYFLSHFHSDHYSGLSPSWSKGIIFCSQISARLLIQVLKVPPQFIFPLPNHETVVIDGSEVTLVDANHCPGAVQLLFKVPCRDGDFERYVHTGDFRYHDSMRFDTFLNEFVNCDGVFLDTTYCNPKFLFPSQEESVEYIVNVIERIGGEYMGSKKGVLFLVATYVIGKEKILVGIAQECNRKIHVDPKKMVVLCALGYGESGVFTEDESESDVHVVGWNVLGETWPYFRPNFLKMKEIMVERGYEKVVGFVPTGWTYEVKRNKFSVRTKDSFEIHLVPYSEHSNYDELREYVRLLKPKRVIPTVGMDVEKVDSKHASKMQKHFVGLVDEMANKKEFLVRFHRGSGYNEDKLVADAGGGLKEGLCPETEENMVEVKAVADKKPDIVLDDSTTLQEPRSHNSTLLYNEETEKMIQELRDCLPAWVTRDQLLGLISSSGRHVVDAVSNFYERETEFHDQVFASSSSVHVSETSLLNVPLSLSKSVSVKSGPHVSFSIPLSQDHKSPNTKQFMKRNTSPGKTKRNNSNKPNKKVKINSKLEASGSKQSMITTFFNKISSNLAQGNGSGHMSKQCTEDENSLQSDATKCYEEKIDRFIRIINGNESSRSYIATILEKTKGDINMALDIYYGSLVGILDEKGENLVAPGELVQVRHFTNKCSPGQQKSVLEEPGHMVNLSIKGDTLVSLPPEKYTPIEHACWTVGQPAPYIHLARTFELVEAEKGKIKVTSMLCNMFRSLLALSPEDVLPAVYLCTNKLAADHENMELNIGGSLVASAIEEACGTSRSKIREMYNSFGDLGDVAQQCRQTQKLLAPPPPLLIRDVFSVLRKISVQTGSGSTVRKKSLIMNLMRSCREKEMKFIVRTLVRNLRIGAMMRTVLPAMAQAIVLNSFCNFPLEGMPENLKEKLQCLSAAVVEAYNILPNLDLVIPSIIDKGIGFTSSTLSMVPGIPIKPMLAKIANGVPQALKRFQNIAFTCEYKYDGQRAQIHKLMDGTVRVFSRNGEETTSRFPDLITIIKESCKPAAVTFILDAEVVAVDRKNDCKIMSFQDLSYRERGSKDSIIPADSIKVNICVFAFDIMFANGEQLLGFPLRQRRKYLKDFFYKEKLGYFEYAKQMIVEAEDACLTNESLLTNIESFLKDAINSSCEGIMVKSLDVDAEYSPSKRTDTWLKVKRDYVEGLNDSLDLVPIGAWYGNGRKAGWYSPFLMACYNPETEEFQSVCRVMSGFSDSFYIEMKEFFSGDKALPKKPPYYRTAEVPDMWFSPELVWEIRGADFTVSPVHQAALGLVHQSRGISIRFPRFIRIVSDRNPEECSTAADIAEMFHSQTRKMDVTAEN
ncbi:DNA_ligase_A_M domain-containing protein/DNA_ligase_A_N domain-containing protein/DNA_ligase_A_C domain-containing protein/DRMBL domain-containing protein/Lactamase_B_2 domain-containing protein [Cephalotus follicularis]|uniref:DNA ligase n=1 Tax=Cephalotus follicularis TaxID=3775 RepID=A0A1Q3D584_CEPFO|nr:DNA_ligase_A_M domain-containing protein/DNA_ligase_A_N domain-containing protein/DNA_ligase_A_C domain-containing protein/DRMBL domain-containing protein/Lactamase_B_2 domain-containing protein [Cephalotus follicularis]